jgi:hypothetical protein
MTRALSAGRCTRRVLVAHSLGSRHASESSYLSLASASSILASFHSTAAIQVMLKIAIFSHRAKGSAAVSLGLGRHPVKASGTQLHRQKLRSIAEAKLASRERLFLRPRAQERPTRAAPQRESGKTRSLRSLQVDADCGCVPRQALASSNRKTAAGLWTKQLKTAATRT